MSLGLGPVWKAENRGESGDDQVNIVLLEIVVKMMVT